MAVFVHPNSVIPLFSKMKWAFGVYLEAIVVFPQLRMMQRTKVHACVLLFYVTTYTITKTNPFIIAQILNTFQMIEPFTAHYVFALGVSRFFGAAYWILRVSYHFQATSITFFNCK